jgi:hypothetical protein
VERWAANTLRGLGILVTAVVMILACLLLLLLSLCTWKSPNNGQSVGFLIGAVLVLALGILIIAKLARGLMNDSASQSSVAQTLPPGVPVHISPGSAEALDHLSYAIGASIGLGVLLRGMTLYRLWTIPFAAPAGTFSHLQKAWLIVSVITAVFEYLPYVLLLFRLQKNPDRPALAFSMGIPAASVLHSMSSLSLMWRVFSYPHFLVPTLLPIIAALVLQIVILVLAWRANQRLGYHQEPVSLIVATAAVYVYFIIFGSSNAWMYRFIR